MSMVGQPSAAAAVHRAASSGECAVRFAVATAPSVRARRCRPRTARRSGRDRPVCRSSRSHGSRVGGCRVAWEQHRRASPRPSGGALRRRRVVRRQRRRSAAPSCSRCAGRRTRRPTRDHRGVACELQAGHCAGRADVLEEHLHAEVHCDVASSGVLAATEQCRLLPFARGDVVRAAGVDAVGHDSVAAERRHHGGGACHLADVPWRWGGLQRHRPFAADVLHHAVAHPAGVVGRGGHLPQRSVVGADERRTGRRCRRCRCPATTASSATVRSPRRTRCGPTRPPRGRTRRAAGERRRWPVLDRRRRPPAAPRRWRRVRS
jgi:hypothetical protein